jgi:hypothetical protein
MKKLMMVWLSMALMLPAPAMAVITVLSGEEIIKAYELDEGGNSWEKYREGQNIFMVIQANLGTPHFEVIDAELIFYWKQWENGKKFKYYERFNITDIKGDIDIADLGIVNKKRKVALCLMALFPEDSQDVVALGYLLGERNNKGYIKLLKGNISSHAYDSQGDIVNFEKNNWEIYRTKDFEGESVDAIANAIEQYLIDKNYQPEPEN